MIKIYYLNSNVTSIPSDPIHSQPNASNEPPFIPRRSERLRKKWKFNEMKNDDHYNDDDNNINLEPKSKKQRLYEMILFMSLNENS